MKWLLISKQKTLKNKILKEFKRKPTEFEQIFNWKDFNMKDAKNYNRIILGDDFWKEFRKSGKWKTPIHTLYWDLQTNSSNWGRGNKGSYRMNIVSQCDKCRKKGIRLDKCSGICKECRKTDHVNHNAEIVEFLPDEIQKLLDNEPHEVIKVNDKISDYLIEQVRQVIKHYFPEFKGIYVHYTSRALGQSLYEWHIALNPELENRTHREIIHTIAHELTHQMCRLQGVLRGRSAEVDYLYDQQIPHGELQTDIWTFARDKKLVSHGYFFYSDKEFHATLKETHNGFTDEYYKERRWLNVKHFEKQKHHIHELSKQALNHRKNGMINYRKWFRDEMLKINIRGNSPYEN